MKLLIFFIFVVSAWEVTEALKCLACLSNEQSGKFCRKVSEAMTVNCPDSSSSCTALVFLKNGKVNVNRGCGGQVSAWSFGSSECDIMQDDALLDTGMALYQCRGNQCNNIEPAGEATQLAAGSDVVLLTKAVQSSNGSVFVQGSSSSSRGKKPSSSTFSSGQTNSGDEEDNSDQNEAEVKPQPVRTVQKVIVTLPPKRQIQQQSQNNQSTDGDEDQVTVAVTNKRVVPAVVRTPQRAVQPPSPENDGEARETSSDGSYGQKPPTTTITTTKKRRIAYPDNEVELKAVVVTENTLRPARRGVAFLLTILGQGSLGLNCFSCLPSNSTGQDCRAIAGQATVNCSDSKHCVAVVLGNAKGEITVYRGCGNHVEDFKLGGDECSMLDLWTDDLPAAYYKCKTDGCNNIEPVTTEVTEIIRLVPQVPVNATSG
ncbi:hypothetical protein BV898_12561 [Hypsibius exemplaris]|uniref:UPAR/Ly6 domain-containing protein n=1 Tax=Hypsibius exemplaris TaxID=2072580 RepID=A0A1W0WDG3_HYPEX|nr:hypothetical protein BV898_12561 [Hypsibius exemplaris]